MTLHDGGSARLEVVLPEAPWAGSGVLDGTRAGHGDAVDDAVADVLMAQTRSSRPGPWLAGVLESLAAPAAGATGAADGGPVPARTADGMRAAGVMGRLDAVELAGVVAATERLASWARSLQARAAAALVEVQGGILGVDQAATVIKDRLHVTAREGSVIVNRADRCTRFPDVLDALAAGRIDTRKADTLLGAGAELTDDERAAAIEVLLPEAPTRTWKWLSDQLNALANRLHGDAEELTHAADQRNVWLETAGPGMSLLSALLPAKDGARVFNAVQAGAQALLNVPGQTRRRGQARADALTSLVTGRMVPHLIEEGAGEDVASEGTIGHGIVGEGVDRGPVQGRPVGSVPGGLRVPVTEPGVLVPPVRETDLVPVPDENDGVLSTAPITSTPTTHAAPDGVEAGVVVRGIEVPATVNVTIPASVLADPGDDTPGILDLLGPVPANVAREIAGEGIWYRLVTDPVTGILTDYSTTTYQPPPRLRRAVQARDRTCAHEGCDRPAARCDLDHIDPYNKERPTLPGEPGQTRANNLHALCRRHHNIKTHADWHVERDPVTGLETWTSPTGHTQVYRPDPTDPAIGYSIVNSITTDDDTAASSNTASSNTAGTNTASSNTAEPGGLPTTGLTLARPPRKPAVPVGPLPSTDSSKPSPEGPPF
ncbi:DUF222 domain-containing protein [Myceligenerans pegani]|uniref:DUF222 domain-containing protein n=1 Tax=Myceligenerans pegani TaxID=2776917 RepID=A0ABR9MTP6_9MICO|nr:HNH endonuclease signature motif containing protein [Myceligenerans sp. TRM 65318]MBE1874753.1 DUF222 domain-containing protein [Myceligenerans sp. TRM 65318]MBE3017024.1 DUF222 domain-containing protein [Myceligenerans sp. TRM 65318]